MIVYQPTNMMFSISVKFPPIRRWLRRNAFSKEKPELKLLTRKCWVLALLV